ncbi:MAG: HAD family phosphatase [Lentisphaerae bacterium]|nr:HAD family phosphatase [Lentisphaerota bacterium]
MTQAYIFDMDGTLLDTEILWVRAIGRFLRRFVPDITSEEALALVYGRSWMDIYPEICALAPGVGLSREAMAREIHDIFCGLRDTTDVRIVGSIDLLRELASTSRVCVVSGSPRRDLDESIRLSGVEDLLEFSLAAEDYSPGKPDPACFMAAARKLVLPPSQCLVFEDSAAGVNAARDAGMACVALARDGAPQQDFSRADSVVRDLSEFKIPQPEPC